MKRKKKRNQISTGSKILWKEKYLKTYKKLIAARTRTSPIELYSLSQFFLLLAILKGKFFLAFRLRLP